MKYNVKTNNIFLQDIAKYAGTETDDAREAADYILENAGKDFEDEYDDKLDECYGEIEICGYSYSASLALYRTDETAYRCGMNDYQDSRAEDIKAELESMEDGDELEFYGYTVTAHEDDEDEDDND